MCLGLAVVEWYKRVNDDDVDMDDGGTVYRDVGGPKRWPRSKLAVNKSPHSYPYRTKSDSPHYNWLPSNLAYIMNSLVYLFSRWPNRGVFNIVQAQPRDCVICVAP